MLKYLANGSKHGLYIAFLSASATDPDPQERRVSRPRLYLTVNNNMYDSTAMFDI
jgi:hypothetical protein